MTRKSPKAPRQTEPAHAREARAPLAERGADNQANAAKAQAETTEAVNRSEGVHKDPAKKGRGGARPGAGRRRRSPEQIRELHTTARYLHDVVALRLASVTDNCRRGDQTSVNVELEGLARECPQYKWPKVLIDRELSALVGQHVAVDGRAKANAPDAGIGVRKVAGWLVSRALDFEDNWYARHVRGVRPLQTIGSGPPALFPPETEADPMGYFRNWLLPQVKSSDRIAALRRFARRWNRTVVRPDVAQNRAAALGMSQPEAISVRFCEACGETLSLDHKKHACSPNCEKIVQRLDHGR